MGNALFILLPFGSLLNFFVQECGTKHKNLVQHKKTCCDRLSKIDLFGPTMVLITLIWTIMVKNLKIERPWSEQNQAALFGILTATLSFLLPLVLNNAIDRNRNAIKVFDAYNGDIISLAWEITTIGGDQEGECDNTGSVVWAEKKKNIFAVLKFLPTLLKHHFRGDFSYEGLKTSTYKDRVKQKGQSTMSDQDVTNIIVETLAKRDPNGEDPINESFFQLMIFIADICEMDKKGGTAKMNILIRQWTLIYEATGDLSSIVNWDEPLLFQFVMMTAFILYIIALPFEFTEHSDWNIFTATVIVYFFAALNSARIIMKNPFASLGKNITIFQTGSKAAEDTYNVVRKIQEHTTSADCQNNSVTFRLKNTNKSNTIRRISTVPLRKNYIPFNKGLKYV